MLKAQLLAVLAALPDSLLAHVFARLTGEPGFPEACRLVDLELERERAGEDEDFVEPDLLLLGGDHLVMMELKTRGGPVSSRGYPPRQLLKDMRLVAECRASDDDRLPRRFTHLMLIPSTQLRWLERREQWVLEIAGGHEGKVRVDPEACLAFGSSSAMRRRELLRQALASTPIYYRSWGQWAEAFRLTWLDSPMDQYRLHWERVGAEVEELARRVGTSSHERHAA